MLANRSIPQSTVIPELGYPDVGEAVAWLCAAFGFTVRLRIANHRAQLNVGDGAMVVTQINPGGKVDGTSSVLVRVENADGHCEHARRHGALILREPADYPYGERQYSVQDLAGHRWTFTQSIADADPRDWGGSPGQL
ncbi:MAG TPA: VOC family protein [Bryobacteraceae bacterium]